MAYTVKAFALDSKNQVFFNMLFGEPKEMKCYLCNKHSISHGNNAQPFCKESRQELVCDGCNDLVLHTRKYIAEMGGHPYKMTAPQECLDGARKACGYEEDYQRSTSPTETSAPTRETKQTKSQSKRAM
tara:strand:- start:705 stop:1091 length:387 start_codon:yes stop_codon:yes gene_type:complete